MKLLITFLFINLKNQVEHKTNFIILCFIILPVQLSQIIFSWTISQNFKSIINWNKWELIFLYALIYFSYSFSQVFFKQFRYIYTYTIDGQFDIFFLKPGPIIKNYILYNLSIVELVSQFIPATILLIVVCIKLDIVWNIKKIIILVLALISGIGIQACIFILIGLPAFFLLKSTAFERFYFLLKDYLNYPLNIFGEVVEFILTAIIPMGYINYYPSLYILEKTTTYSLSNILFFPIAIFLVIGTLELWKRALKNYSSGGG